MEIKCEIEDVPKEYINGINSLNEISESLKNKMIENMSELVKNITIKKIKGTAVGYYLSSQKEILINSFKDIDMVKKAIIHKLTHVASSRQEVNGEITRIGFFDINKNLGKGLNEAFTEYYTRKIYEKCGKQDNLKIYGDLIPIARDLISLYGDSAILDSYVNGSNLLEEIMKSDGIDFDEFKKSVDNYYKAVHEDENTIYESPLKKPEVSGLYEKIGNFIENIKENRGVIELPSEWKKVHSFLLEIKNLDDYTIREIYTNFLYFNEKIKSKAINVTSCNINNFIAKLNMVKGLFDYKKALDKLPYIASNSNNMINNILDNVINAKIERYSRNSVEYNENKKEIVFENDKLNDNMYSEMVIKFTKIALKDLIRDNNLYRGIIAEKIKYISNDILNNNNGKHINTSNYSKLIELFGEKNMLELNKEGFDNIRTELKNAGVNDEFFEAFNNLNDSECDNYKKHNSEEIINSAFIKVLKYRAENDILENEKKTDISDYAYDIKPKQSLIRWIKEKIIDRIFKKEKIIMLDEAKKEDVVKEDFLAKYKFDVNNLEQDCFEMNYASKDEDAEFQR